jgi:Beta-galactosidase
MRRALVAAMLAASVALITPAGADAAGRHFWGVVFRHSDATQQDLDLMHHAHVGSARIILSWPDIQPQENGSFDWSGADQKIGSLASRGIPVVPVFQGSPPYVASNPNTPPVHSKSARSEWKRFLRAAVNRYRPKGNYWTGLYPIQHPGRRAIPVKAWQVSNEPNLPSMFHSNNPVRDYARLLKISHQAIKGAARHAKVILAGMPGFAQFHSWRFLDRLYRIHGTKSHFEIGAPHPYAPSQSLVALQVNRYRHVMKKHGDGNTPIWFTEFGWGSGHPDGDINKGLKGQARNLKRSFRIFAHNRRRWHLKRVFWFEWRDPSTPTNQCPFCDDSGLLRKSYTKKPSYGAYKRFVGHH